MLPWLRARTLTLSHTRAPAAVDGAAAEKQLALLQAPAAEAWQLGVALLGFMMFKVAVLGVSLSQPGVEEPESLTVFERNTGV